MAWKNAKGGFVYWLNRFLNPNHQWFDYYNPSTGEMDPKEGAGSLRNDSATYGSTGSSYNSFLGSLGPAVNALVNRWTDAHATQGEIERNEMQMQNQEDIYQRQVTGMQKAGINPALMYGSGVSSAPNVTTSGSGGASMSDLMQLLMLPLQKKLLQSQAKLAENQGTAALMNAGANVRNAASNERNAGSNEMNAETARMRQQVEAFLAQKDIQVKDATITKMASETAQINLITGQLPKQLEIAQQNADANTKHAYASLQSALASVRQAAVAEKLSDSEIALREARAYVLWAQGDGQHIINSHLDERLQKEIAELASRSSFLDANAANLDRNEKVQWMSVITGYLGAATSIANGVSSSLGNVAPFVIP